MAVKYDWTPEKVALVREMREEGKTYRTISNAIGDIGPDAIRRMHDKNTPASNSSKKRMPKENSKGSRRLWSDTDLAILKREYEAGTPVPDIATMLADKRTYDVIFVTAARHGYRRPKKAKIQADASTRKKPASTLPKCEKVSPIETHEPTVIKLMKAGLSPSDTALVTKFEIESIRRIFEAHGWKRKGVSATERHAMRKRVMAKAAEIIGSHVDYANPEHIMVIMSLAADETRRNLVETARLCCLPLIYVERVFGVLDSTFIWPVTDRRNTDLTEDDYQMFARVCKGEMALAAG